MFEGRIVKEGGPELVTVLEEKGYGWIRGGGRGGRLGLAIAMALALPTAAEFPDPGPRGPGLPGLGGHRADRAARRSRRWTATTRTYRASIHRGVYPLADEATDAYEGARERDRRVHRLDRRRDGLHAQRDRGAQPRRARLGPRDTSAADDLVVVTAHGAPLEHRPVADARLPARLRRDRRRRACSTSTRSTRCSRSGPKLVAVAHVSNVLGTINPVEEIARRAHAAGAIVVVDGSQAVPHLPVDVAALGADFYAWTGPQGLRPDRHRRPARAPRAARGDAEPLLGGGHMISRVGDFESTLGRAAREVRGRHDADRRGDRARRRRRVPRPGSAWSTSASTRATSSATRSSGCDEVDGLTMHGPARRRRARRGLLVRARRRPPARRRRDPRPRAASACAPATTARSR